MTPAYPRALTLNSNGYSVLMLRLCLRLRPYVALFMVL